MSKDSTAAMNNDSEDNLRKLELFLKENQDMSTFWTEYFPGDMKEILTKKNIIEKKNSFINLIIKLQDEVTEVNFLKKIKQKKPLIIITLAEEEKP